MKCTLMLLDTIGIQEYIFASNRLRENIGASEIVEKVVKQWAYEAVQELFPNRHNVVNPKQGTLDPAKRIEDGQIDAEVIYSGGGNTAILFCSAEQAKAFTRCLSKQVLICAPRLQFATTRQAVDIHSQSLAKAVRCALSELGASKRNRPISMPLFGLGVTAECQSTGLPAAGEDPRPMPNESPRLVSLEVAAKLIAAQEAKQRLEELLSGLSNIDKFAIPHEFDHLGRIYGEESYLAVVHADGNNMGYRVGALAKKFEEGSIGNNRKYIEAMRRFSASIQAASHAALKACVAKLLNAGLLTKTPSSNFLLADRLPLVKDKDENDGKPYLPFRPLVFGGDDVTFVCNGLLGLALAVEYLHTFESQTLCDDTDTKPRACAGIAVVKLHYPFSRAYELSEDLCQSAKGLIAGKDLSALDWHFSTTGLLGNLETIREREYTTRDGKLYLRPVRLEDTPTDLHSWPTVAVLLRDFRDNWSQRRNKVMRLRASLREGPEAVEQFVHALKDKPELPLAPGFQNAVQKTGWHDGVCVYFDAIEAMDYCLLV